MISFLIRRVAPILTLIAGLAGCVLPQEGSDRVTLLGGRYIVAAPAGFCVDPKSRRDNGTGSFVLFGDCATITGATPDRRPARAAVLSATIGPETPGPIETTFPGFDRFFHSAAGRAMLARSGAAGDVEILQVRQTGATMLLKIRDRSAPRDATVSQVYWRAIVDLGGRITALSVLPLRTAPMPDTAQIRLLEEFVAAIRTANGWS
ncbi:MAG TPA: cation transport ATPase [Paenirhodobacter sp.]